MTSTIYAIYATDVDRNHLLGYCISNSRKDIEAYYDEKKGYGLHIEEVKPVHIPQNYANRKQKLVKQKIELEHQIKQLDQQINLLS